MKYKIIHLFVKLTNLFQSKIVTTKVNKIIFLFVFYYRCDSHATKDFTRFYWIIHDHVIHELYCHINISNSVICVAKPKSASFSTKSKFSGRGRAEA
jgi:hypothetical protein